MRQCAHCKAELTRHEGEYVIRYQVRRFCSAKCGHAGMDTKTAKLTVDHVRAIRQEIARGEPNAAIANRYGVSAPAIWAIKMGRSWKEVL